ncbi:hypothetical protein B566_EDAN012058 [Ephemera danica]|nr:hypothetical protein B566_EDAN012058 [Ephemera danica]
MRVVYITTSRSVKRLEGITRSPVFTHLNASIQGLSTIRAFRAQKLLETQFDGHQDLHSSAWYLFISTSRAFGYWLDIICFFYIALVTLSFLVLGNEFGGNVGLAITQAIGLTGMFQWGMRQSAELENQMTSVERVLEFSKLDSEPPLITERKNAPPKDWPMKGEVVFDKLSLRYSPSEPSVLKQISFTVNPGEKVGIVGRTGAGKSSLISALFRLAECHEGRILIDGVDTSSLGLHQLRASISIIPQEPVLFSGTMRKNLDPFDDYPDAVLWKALEEVELRDAVTELPGGLSAHMSEGGSNFSVGQRQLVCLARAIVRKNRILVLDEATANVDPKTDALIQNTIRRKFASCTVLTIAHRLHTIMDADRVLVMEAGRVAEFASPSILLSEPDSMLSRLAEQTGHANATNLRHRASLANPEQIMRSSQELEVSKSVSVPQEVAEIRSTGTVSGEVYSKYFSAGGNCCVIFTMFALNESASFNESAFNATGTEAYESDSWLTTELCIYIYSSTIAAVLLISIVRSFVFFNTCMRASVRLHDSMFSAITRATMAFFNNNPSGM